MDHRDALFLGLVNMNETTFRLVDWSVLRSPQIDQKISDTRFDERSEAASLPFDVAKEILGQPVRQKLMGQLFRLEFTAALALTDVQDDRAAIACDEALQCGKALLPFALFCPDYRGPQRRLKKSLPAWRFAHSG